VKKTLQTKNDRLVRGVKGGNERKNPRRNRGEKGYEGTQRKRTIGTGEISD